ncbi:MAG TPA: glycine betaine ABC transporter substrate-binding protein [Rubrobacteraceae bacterium]|nr:glycine betaine ABC transporter substrate-binding protein [Rubrobacteraceae bacterium]
MSFATVFLAALVVLLAGCGSGEASKPADASGLKLRIGYAGFGEDKAVSELTKVLLEERMGHGEVELRRVGIHEAYRDVADRKLDAFQGVRMPGQQKEFEKVSDRTALFNSWIIGTTRASLAVPSYMKVRNPEQLDQDAAAHVLTIRPDASPVGEIPKRALADYGLRVEREYRDAPAMLDEVDRLYKEKKPFVFIAWTPHWMNDEYDINYLEDPKGSLSEITRPGSLHMLVRKDLQEKDPLAHALMDAILLTETEATNLQVSIRQAKSPKQGVHNWIKEHDNDKLVKGWVESARKRVADG